MSEKIPRRKESLEGEKNALNQSLGNPGRPAARATAAQAPRTAQEAQPLVVGGGQLVIYNQASADNIIAAWTAARTPLAIDYHPAVEHDDEEGYELVSLGDSSGGWDIGYNFAYNYQPGVAYWDQGGHQHGHQQQAQTDYGYGFMGGAQILFDMDEYLRLYQEALTMLLAEEEALERERAQAVEKAKEATAKPPAGTEIKAKARKSPEQKKAEKLARKEKALAKQAAKAAEESGSDPVDSDEDLDDEAVFAIALANKKQREAELKRRAEELAKQRLKEEAEKTKHTPSKDGPTGPVKKALSGKVTENASGMKVNSKSGKIKFPNLTINLTEVEHIEEHMDEHNQPKSITIHMPGGLSIDVACKSKLAKHLNEIRDRLLKEKAEAAKQWDALA